MKNRILKFWPFNSKNQELKRRNVWLLRRKDQVGMFIVLPDIREVQEEEQQQQDALTNIERKNKIKKKTLEK